MRARAAQAWHLPAGWSQAPNPNFLPFGVNFMSIMLDVFRRLERNGGSDAAAKCKFLFESCPRLRKRSRLKQKKKRHQARHRFKSLPSGTGDRPRRENGVRRRAAAVCSCLKSSAAGGKWRCFFFPVRPVRLETSEKPFLSRLDIKIFDQKREMKRDRK